MPITSILTSDFKGDNLDVRMWGCRVDGVTNDTTNFQAAINECATLGSALMIPGDNVLLCSSVKLPSNLILIGRPGAKIRQIANSATSSTPFIINSTTGGGGNANLILQGITFDGNSTHQSATNVDILSLFNQTNAAIRECGFINAVRGQIFGQKLTNISIEDCVFSNWGVGNVGAVYLAARASNNFGGPGGAINQINIRGCTVDGRVSHSSCIKIDADASDFITGVIVASNFCYPGDASGTGAADKSTLGIELYNGTPGTSSTFNFTINGNIIEGENSTGPDIFGISMGGAGCINGSCSGNSLQWCNAFGIETIGSNISVKGNNSNTCGQWTVDCGSVSVAQIVIEGNTILNPVIAFGIIIGIHVIAHSTSGPGPYTISDVLIRGNIIASSSASSTDLIVVESQVSGYNIWDVQISGNHVIGPNTASGIGIGPNTGTCQFVTIRDNYFYGLSNGINVGGTYSRYLFNRFNGVTTQYNGSFPSDAIVIDIDSSLSSPVFEVQNLQLRGQPGPILLSTGDASLPNETNGFQSGASAEENPANPNIVTWNGVNFGTTIQGGIISVNSRWSGGGNWTQTSSNAYTGAMFAVLGASAFLIRIGNATNTQGATPGNIAFYVAGGDAVYTGAGYPIDVESTGYRIYAFNGNPNSSVTATVGAICLDGSGNIWGKATGSGNTGWVEIASTSGSGVSSLSPGTLTGAVTLAVSNSGTGGPQLTIGDAGSTITVTQTQPGSWSTYSPSISLTGGISTISSQSILSAAYQQEGKSVDVQVTIQATIVFGVGTTYINIPLPVTPVSVSGSQACQGLGITLQDGSSLLDSSGAIFDSSGSTATFNPGFSGATTTVIIYMFGRYQAA